MINFYTLFNIQPYHIKYINFIELVLILLKLYYQLTICNKLFTYSTFFKSSRHCKSIIISILDFYVFLLTEPISFISLLVLKKR